MISCYLYCSPLTHLLRSSLFLFGPAGLSAPLTRTTTTNQRALDDPRPWLPNLASAGQSFDRDPLCSEGRPPGFSPRPSPSFVAKLGQAPSPSSSVSWSALTKPAEPKTNSGTSVTRPFLHYDTGLSHDSIGPSSSARRGVRRSIGDPAGASLPTSLDLDDVRGVGQVLPVS